MIARRRRINDVKKIRRSTRARNLKYSRGRRYFIEVEEETTINDSAAKVEKMERAGTEEAGTTGFSRSIEAGARAEEDARAKGV